MYTARVENNGDSRNHATTKNHAFMMGGDGQGASPIETVLAGLCGCVAHYTRDFLKAERLEGKRFSVSARAGLTEDGRKIGNIDVDIAVEGAPLDDRLSKELLRFVENCPVHGTLKEACVISVSLPGQLLP